MGLFKYLENKQKEERMNAQRIRIYNDIANVLWYAVLYDDVLHYKREQMDGQKTPFRKYVMGNTSLNYGPVVALTSQEDVNKFERVATAQLRHLGYGKVRVKAYPEEIVVTWSVK